jgi:putative membrane protein insertion efficiency factor
MKTIVIQFIIFYQKFVSPLFGRQCRFYPSCSQYSILAIEKYGLVIGLCKTLLRVLKCNPLNPGGVDFP